MFDFRPTAWSEPASSIEQKGADWRNYNRSWMQSLLWLRTLMKDARGGPIR